MVLSIAKIACQDNGIWFGTILKTMQKAGLDLFMQHPLEDPADALCWLFRPCFGHCPGTATTIQNLRVKF